MSSTITVRIEDASKVQLDILARSTRRTKSWLAAQAIEAYLKREAAEIQAIEEAIKEANKSDAIKYDHETVMAWLMSWGTPNEVPSPRTSCK